MIKFSKIKVGAILPTKRDEDAGYDLYACIDSDSIILEPNETVAIPVGLMSAFPDTIVGIIKERGSTGIKGIGVRGGVIDSGFRGEWGVLWTNHNNHRVILAKDTARIGLKDGDEVYPYTKAIAQVVFVPLDCTEIEEVNPEDLLLVDSSRGSGKFGSSGK
jgi:dUTP pyrophosphatase